jgi:hypothetical protein
MAIETPSKLQKEDISKLKAYIKNKNSSDLRLVTNLPSSRGNAPLPSTHRLNYNHHYLPSQSRNQNMPKNTDLSDILNPADSFANPTLHHPPETVQRRLCETTEQLAANTDI